MNSPAVTRSSADKAKIQTRAVVKSRVASRLDRGGGVISDKDKVLKAHSDQHRQQSKSSRQPNLSLIEAKKRGKMLKIQQQEQLKQGQILTSEGALISQGKDQISMAVPFLGAVKDIYQNAVNCKIMERGATGLIYDESMKKHCCFWDPQHPECPERFSYVLQRCRELNLENRCKILPSVRASKEEVLRLHSEELYEILQKTSQMTNEEDLEELSSRYDSIYLHPSTFELSLLSVGCTRSLVENIILGHIQNGMAIIRPPGHHAMKAEFSGYCFFNNVALAAKYALDTLNLSRILIVDWDVHHGQGTQRFFYEDPRVLYFSIHRFEFGTYWPNLKESNFDAIGQNAGLGYNFNVPLNKTGMGNGDYLAIFQQLLIPVAFEFQPELVIISAGYDAALGCIEGEMEVTPACYPHLINPLLQLANGRIAVILEGGYCLESLAEGAALTLRALLGDPCPILVEKIEPPCDLMQEAILNCIYTHRAYWKCLQVQDTYTIEELNNFLPVQFNMHQVSQNYIGGPESAVSTVDDKLSAFKEANSLDCKRYPTRNNAPVLPIDFIQRNMLRLEKLKKETSLITPKTRVCYVYDELMLKHINLFEKGHPEQPERIRSIYKMHQDYKLLERMLCLPSRRATPEEVSLVHSLSHVELIRKMGDKKQKKHLTKADRNVEDEDYNHLLKMSTNYNSVYFHPNTYESATMATGCALQVVDSVLKGESRCGVCIVRPPGHHAESSEPHGFCIFNNVAIAARYAINRYHLQRVLIIDWDVHHGNGTQHIFDSTPEVLYMSLHRYDNGSFFPKGKDGNYDMIGKGEGAGYNVNIPWNRKGMGDFEYALAFQHLIMPIAYEYNPQLVLISAGFDAAIGDPLGGCKVTPEAYGLFSHWLSSLANGRVILCLEGGYNIHSIAYAMTLCTKSLLGDPLPTLQMPVSYTRLTAVTYQSCIKTLRNCVGALQPYWKCLTFGKRLPMGTDKDKSSSLIIEEDESTLHIVADIKKLKIDNDQIDDKIYGESNSGSIEVKVGGPKEINESDLNDHIENAGIASASGASNEETVKPLTLTEYLKEHEQALQNEEMFAVIPLKSCIHLSYLKPEEAPTIIRTDAPCVECLSTAENWYCLHCYQVLCGRYILQHMLYHHIQTEHPLALSFSDLSVWCYGCEAYIDNPQLFIYKARAHRYKFGEELVWSYGDAKLYLEKENKNDAVLYVELESQGKTNLTSKTNYKNDFEDENCRPSESDGLLSSDCENRTGAKRKQFKCVQKIGKKEQQKKNILSLHEENQVEMKEPENIEKDVSEKYFLEQQDCIGQNIAAYVAASGAGQKTAYNIGSQEQQNSD